MAVLISLAKKLFLRLFIVIIKCVKATRTFCLFNNQVKDVVANLLKFAKAACLGQNGHSLCPLPQASLQYQATETISNES